MRCFHSHQEERGDTIIEVLLAMTLLTLILFTSWGLVNRATQLNLAARKRIDMVNQLKEQAEILKVKYASNKGSLVTMTDELKVQASNAAVPVSTNYKTNFCSQPENVGGASSAGFHFNTSAEAVNQGKKIDENGSSFVWIERVNGSGYSDFYIRGCWLTSGGQQKTDNAQFVVRLNV